MLTVIRPIEPLALAIVSLVVLAAPAAAAPERGDKPALRSTLPAHVDAPRDRSEKVRVVSPPRAAERAPVDVNGKVNINSADVKQLMTLTGVGRKVAEKIVEYRDAHGPFKRAEEIRKVEGVGTGLWEKNRARIVIK